MNNMFHFWYRFVLVNVSIISCGAVDLAYRRVGQLLSNSMGLLFEEICKQNLWRELLKCNCTIKFNDLGRLGTNPKVRQQENRYYGKSDLFIQYTKKHYYIFSQCDFIVDYIDCTTEMRNVYLSVIRRCLIDNC